MKVLPPHAKRESDPSTNHHRDSGLCEKGAGIRGGPCDLRKQHKGRDDNHSHQVCTPRCEFGTKRKGEDEPEDGTRPSAPKYSQAHPQPFKLSTSLEHNRKDAFYQKGALLSGYLVSFGEHSSLETDPKLCALEKKNKRDPMTSHGNKSFSPGS